MASTLLAMASNLMQWASPPENLVDPFPSPSASVISPHTLQRGQRPNDLRCWSGVAVAASHGHVQHGAARCTTNMAASLRPRSSSNLTKHPTGSKMYKGSHPCVVCKLKKGKNCIMRLSKKKHGSQVSISCTGFSSDSFCKQACNPTHLAQWNL